MKYFRTIKNKIISLKNSYKQTKIKDRIEKKSKAMLDRILKLDKEKAGFKQAELRRVDFDKFVEFMKSLEATYSSMEKGNA